ncbi:zinc ribbon domain-containing protein [Candidatus Leptofilum sp.]|uniref:zinc ribbon domain-containing protein n=1 Tax=Candidatus Leptofilum sp. TaxID=3241576 RepID=UPI003B59EA9B
MKRTIILLIALLFFPAMIVQAQTTVTLQSLDVELWPDYDREAVLVLLTGTLPANQPLPVTLTVPLPAGADFNVVARITDNNVMSDQGLSPVVENDSITFTLEESRFRVEYYQPYSASNTQRSFTFFWQSDIAVEQMNVTLQQPFTATEVNTVPPATNVAEGQDGLTYHVLPSQTVAAGDSYSVEVGYTMSVPTLTVDFLADAAPAEEELPFLDAEPVQDEGATFDWPLLLVGLGAVILVATAVYFFINNRQSSSRRPAKPKPQRTQQKPAARKMTGSAKYCHQCGQSLTSGDKFCRNCGTAVKAK